MKTIGILGAGWLGKPLALFLQEKGHQVKVSVRSEEKKNQLQNSGLSSFVLQIDQNEIQGDLSFFNEVDVLIISLTPQQISIFKTLLEIVKQYNIQKVILFSSTGIYTDCSGKMNENHLLQLHIPKVKLLKEIEDVFLNESSISATILRLGGLIGPNRNPVTFLAKKEFIEEGNEPVNIAYQETIIETISALLNTKLHNTVFNITEDDHRTKEAFYTEAAKQKGLVLPNFKYSTNPKNRIVLNDKIKEFLR